MSIIGKTAVAPCGHTGEVIIGTYVRCSQGCEGPARVTPRGQIGHVVNCACKPCQLRRLTHTIILRDKDGKDFAKVNWNGVDDKLDFKAEREATIRHYQFLDADGKIIAKGDISAYLMKGDFKIRVDLLVDALVKNQVAKMATTQGLRDVVTITIVKTNVPAPTGTMGWWAGLIP